MPPGMLPDQTDRVQSQMPGESVGAANARMDYGWEANKRRDLMYAPQTDYGAQVGQMGGQLAQGVLNQGVGMAQQGMAAQAVNRGANPLAQRAAIYGGGQAAMQGAGMASQAQLQASMMGAQMSSQQDQFNRNLAFQDLNRMSQGQIAQQQMAAGRPPDTSVGDTLMGLGTVVGGIATMSDERTKRFTSSPEERKVRSSDPWNEYIVQPSEQTLFGREFSDMDRHENQDNPFAAHSADIHRMQNRMRPYDEPQPSPNYAPAGTTWDNPRGPKPSYGMASEDPNWQPSRMGAREYDMTDPNQRNAALSKMGDAQRSEYLAGPGGRLGQGDAYQMSPQPGGSPPGQASTEDDYWRQRMEREGKQSTGAGIGQIFGGMGRMFSSDEHAKEAAFEAGRRAEAESLRMPDPVKGYDHGGRPLPMQNYDRADAAGVVDRAGESLSREPLQRAGYRYAMASPLREEKGRPEDPMGRPRELVNIAPREVRQWFPQQGAPSEPEQYYKAPGMSSGHAVSSDEHTKEKISMAYQAGMRAAEGTNEAKRTGVRAGNDMRQEMADREQRLIAERRQRSEGLPMEVPHPWNAPQDPFAGMQASPEPLARTKAIMRDPGMRPGNAISSDERGKSGQMHGSGNTPWEQPADPQDPYSQALEAEDRAFRRILEQQRGPQLDPGMGQMSPDAMAQMDTAQRDPSAFRQFMYGTPLQEYSYKPETGFDTTPRPGTGARTLAQAGPMGQSMTQETPQGMVIDQDQGMGAAIGGVARNGREIEAIWSQLNQLNQNRGW